MLLRVQPVIVRATVGLNLGPPSLGLMVAWIVAGRAANSVVGTTFLLYPDEDLVSGCLSC